jgi:2-iminobutanoate/2-iminopropanoate deaminase
MRKFITSGEGVVHTNPTISQAVVAGNYCHVSGQLAVLQDGTFHHGTALEQAEIAFKNLFAALKAADFAISDIVFVDIAFIDLKDLAEITPFYNTLFPQDRKPARTIYQAAALPMGGKIKVMAVAIKV